LVEVEQQQLVLELLDPMETIPLLEEAQQLLAVVEWEVTLVSVALVEQLLDLADLAVDNHEV
jgi:hypothetical protein